VDNCVVQCCRPQPTHCRLYPLWSSGPRCRRTRSAGARVPLRKRLAIPNQRRAPIPRRLNPLRARGSLFFCPRFRAEGSPPPRAASNLIDRLKPGAARSLWPFATIRGSGFWYSAALWHPHALKRSCGSRWRSRILYRAPGFNPKEGFLLCRVTSPVIWFD
jgi:hypothetical protein